MPLFRSKAEQKVVDAGFDPARLPPGQYLTEKWPVLHAGDVAHVDLATWRLRISGEVEEEVTLDYEQLRALPATEITTDIHCVTRWSRFDAGFRGVHWRELAKLCRPKPSAHFAIAHAEARSEEHTSELQSLTNLVCRLLLEKKKKKTTETETKIWKATSSKRA